jgi:DEAD/DEAH box helicase domain-containing protein
MKFVVFDIETRNIFQDVGSNDPAALDISVLSLYDSQSDQVMSFLQEDFGRMWQYFERTDVLIGYNSDHFDIPLLDKYYHGDLTSFKSIDIMKSIKQSLGRRPKLDDVAHATLGKKKIAHGLEAVQWWKEGKIDKIKKYCEEDVMITKQLFDYIMQHKHVKLKDFSGKKATIPIDTSSWDASGAVAVTQSLPW